MKLFHILRADGTRWFGRRKMWAAIIGITAADYLMLGQDASTISVSSVLDMVYLYIGDPFFILCLMLSATVMGTSYCDERETGCFFLLMNRCSRKKYIISKIIHTFFSALFVLTAGTFLWICSMRLFMPWANPQEDSFRSIASNGMGELLLRQNYPLYFFLHSLGYGMTAGIVSAATFLISMILKDKMLVQVLPVLLYYINTIFFPSYSERCYTYSLSNIFYFIDNSISSTKLLLARGIGICIFLLFIFGSISYWILGRNFYGTLPRRKRLPLLLSFLFY